MKHCKNCGFTIIRVWWMPLWWVHNVDIWKSMICPLIPFYKFIATPCNNSCNVIEDHNNITI